MSLLSIHGLFLLCLLCGVGQEASKKISFWVVVGALTVLCGFKWCLCLFVLRTGPVSLLSLSLFFFSLISFSFPICFSHDWLFLMDTLCSVRNIDR